MSIWVTRIAIDAEFDNGSGEVMSYPHNDLRRIETDCYVGSIDTAHSPHWCVPGHDFDDGCEEIDDLPLAPWLRLGVWVPDQQMSVVLDREAALTLGEDLIRWANRKHTNDNES